jgi:DNA-binding GntR family transcriptional regulator
MTKPTRQGSRADLVRNSLRIDILAGRLAPGRRLTFPELCSTYSVSVGVLREALVRLVDLGIVRTESNLGFSVMPLSDDDLRGLTTTRCLIEPGFVREAVGAGSMQWEAGLVAAHHIMERIPMAGEHGVNDEWVTAHAEFHLALVSGTGNRRMLEITRRLREEADLYRRWYLDADAIAGHSEDAAREHRKLLDEALDRDAEAAEKTMRRQIERATELWLAGRPVQQPA